MSDGSYDAALGAWKASARRNWGYLRLFCVLAMAWSGVVLAHDIQAGRTGGAIFLGGCLVVQAALAINATIQRGRLR